jgi:hypothetical protein
MLRPNTRDQELFSANDAIELISHSPQVDETDLGGGLAYSTSVSFLFESLFLIAIVSILHIPLYAYIFLQVSSCPYYH